MYIYIYIKNHNDNTNTIHNLNMNDTYNDATTDLIDIAIKQTNIITNINGDDHKTNTIMFHDGNNENNDTHSNTISNDKIKQVHNSNKGLKFQVNVYWY